MATPARVDVSFPLKNFAAISEQLEAIAIAHGGSRSSSGAGFGMRDMQFDFNTYFSAKDAEDEMEKLNITDMEFN